MGFHSEKDIAISDPQHQKTEGMITTTGNPRILCFVVMRPRPNSGVPPFRKDGEFSRRTFLVRPEKISRMSLLSPIRTLLDDVRKCRVFSWVSSRVHSVTLSGYFIVCMFILCVCNRVRATKPWLVCRRIEVVSEFQFGRTEDGTIVSVNGKDMVVIACCQRVYGRDGPLI